MREHRKRRIAVTIAVAFLVGPNTACTHTRHTVEPYRSEADEASALTSRATAECERRTPPSRRLPKRAFVTDGCSVWPDGEHYVACCVEHDIAYWCGGSREERRAADREFGACVSRASSSLLGSMMRWGVAIGGHPVFPVPYRWGYGHPYRGGYPASKRAQDDHATAAE